MPVRVSVPVNRTTDVTKVAVGVTKLGLDSVAEAERLLEPKFLLRLDEERPESGEIKDVEVKVVS